MSGTGLHELRTLVELSFLQHLPSGRYEVHDLMRQYAEEKLSACPAAQQETRQRHCAFYLDRLPEMEAGLKGARQAETLTVLDARDRRSAPRLGLGGRAGGHFQAGRRAGGPMPVLRAGRRFAEGRSACQGAAEGLAGLDTPEAHHLLAAWPPGRAVFAGYKVSLAPRAAAAGRGAKRWWMSWLFPAWIFGRRRP